METKHVHGIHHITAIAGPPRENHHFYTEVLGLRLVKKSINQDVPDTYHLFFADGAGNPGTDLTFFPWPQMGPGRVGAGVWGEVSFVIPPGSAEYWQERLTEAGIAVGAIETRFSEKVLPFTDPHGMALSLTETETYTAFDFAPWEQSSVPVAHQIRALGSVRLTVRDDSATTAFLSGAFGFSHSGTDGGWKRYTVGEGSGGQRIDIHVDAGASGGKWGVGAVHHVAFRIPDDEQELAVRNQVIEEGGQPSPVIDRFWFKSVYVREPSGALCEVATDGPGFAADEDPDHLGETLVLPPWYESQRAQIEAVLTPL
ncbi:MAG: ring-cleaving dioxygenase [Alkalispirochaeta sp.]